MPLFKYHCLYNIYFNVYACIQGVKKMYYYFSFNQNNCWRWYKSLFNFIFNPLKSDTWNNSFFFIKWFIELIDKIKKNHVFFGLYHIWYIRLNLSTNMQFGADADINIFDSL